MITNPDFSFPLTWHIRELSQSCRSALMSTGTFPPTAGDGDLLTLKEVPGPALWGLLISATLPKRYIFKTVLKYAPVNLKDSHRKYRGSVAALPGGTALFLGGKGGLALFPFAMKKSEAFPLSHHWLL